MSRRVNAIALTVFSCLCAATAAAAAAAAVAPKQAYANCYLALAANPTAARTRAVVDSLNLRETFSNPLLQLTVFTPTDKAYADAAAAMKTTVAALSTNKAVMQQILYYHIVTGPFGGPKAALPLAALRPGLKLNTMLISPATRLPYRLKIVSLTARKATAAAAPAEAGTAAGARATAGAAVVRRGAVVGAAAAATRVPPAAAAAAAVKLGAVARASPAATAAAAAPAVAAGAQLGVRAVGSIAGIVQPDQRCGAGVAHGIDTLLLPVVLPARRR